MFYKGKKPVAQGESSESSAVQIGDLVRHKRTRTLGILLKLPKHDFWYDVQWVDASNAGRTSHLKGELITVSTNRRNK